MFTFDFITMAATRINNGMAIFKPLYWLFGKAMEGLLIVFNDQYFLALVVFTIITRMVLFPLNLRQQKTMAKTTRLQPKIQKIQKKYANSKDPRDRQKMNEEMQALYQREGHNPMNMGCGPMAFQMVFLMGIIGIIYYPIQYIIGITDFDAHSVEIAKAINYEGAYFQIEILQNFDKYKDILAEQFPKMFTAEKIEAIANYKSHLYIGSLDMTRIPHWKDGIIVIIPILSFLTALASSIVSTLIQRKQNPATAAGQQSQQMMIMMLMMPLFSFYIAFKVSAAVGFYWIISNLVAVVQQLITAKFFPPKKNVAREMVENTIQRRAREESIKKIKG
ncbi:MAG: YidC/Oxa1 family membrane protein insertase [Eubacterium sp.]|nr:YidC/Oxa1 family membrane protein insertase [Eubacterium sp.]